MSKFLQLDTEICFIEDDCVTEDGVVLLKSDDNKNSFISRCRVIHLFFNDPDHLNDIGARKLTEILLNEVL